MQGKRWQSKKKLKPLKNEKEFQTPIQFLRNETRILFRLLKKQFSWKLQKSNKGKNFQKNHVQRLNSLEQHFLLINMIHLIFGGLLSTSAPTAPIVGISFIALFAIVGVMVGPDHEGMNAPASGNSKDTNQGYIIAWLASQNLGWLKN